MVVRELVGLAEWRGLPEEERTILFAAALLHECRETGMYQGRSRWAHLF